MDTAAFVEGSDSFDVGSEALGELGRESLEGWGDPLDDERYRMAAAGFGESSDPQVLVLNAASVELLSANGEPIFAVPFRDVRRFMARDSMTLDLWVVRPPGAGPTLAKYVHTTLDPCAESVERQWAHSQSLPHLGGQLPPVDFRMEPYLYHLGRVVDAGAKVELIIASLLEANHHQTHGEYKRFTGDSGEQLWKPLEKLSAVNPGLAALTERCRAAWARRNQVVHGTFIPSSGGRPSRVVRKYLRGKELEEAQQEYRDEPADLLALTELTRQFDGIYHDFFPIVIKVQAGRPLESVVVPNTPTEP